MLLGVDSIGIVLFAMGLFVLGKGYALSDSPLADYQTACTNASR